MEQKEMSLKEVLEEIRGTLNGVSLPMSLMESEGSKIFGALNLLRICIDSLKDAPAPEGGDGDV